MNRDISNLISGMLSNPDALKNLMNTMAGSMQNSSQSPDSSYQSDGGTAAQAPSSYTAASESPFSLPDISDGNNLEASVQSMLSALNRTDDRRITLLTALKPYMSSSRASGVDRAIKILKLSKLTEVLRNER